jgi:D-alanyl-D-alanine carboxypeptidase (penicillin-binding protein 5/6)
MWGFSWLINGSGSGPLATSSDRGTNAQLRQVHLPTIVPLVPELTTIAGVLPALPIPSAGQSAVYVRGVGLLGASPNEVPVPMASVTKVMTAVIVLEDHPLGRGPGPRFTMTAADHEAWIQAIGNGDSTLDVVAGERLTERQLLEALLIPSADNIADYLARWDAGSIAAFVKKMNAMAAELHLNETHYADASGRSAGSRSTAIDQAILGAYAMSVPGIIALEDHSSMRFPVVGTVPNYNPVIGQDGVIGLKSGFTDPALCCLVTAARRKVGNRIVLVVSSTLGQPWSLAQAGTVDLQLLDAATADLGLHTVLRANQAVASVTAGWSHKRLAAVLWTPVSIVGWPGLIVKSLVKAAVSPEPGLGRGWTAGTKMATVEVSTPAAIQQVAPARLNGFLRSAPARWSARTASTTTSTPAAANN